MTIPIYSCREHNDSYTVLQKRVAVIVQVICSCIQTDAALSLIAKEIAEIPIWKSKACNVYNNNNNNNNNNNKQKATQLIYVINSKVTTTKSNKT